MPASKLVAVGRPATGAAWTLLSVGLPVADTTTAVTDYLAAHPGGRAVVLQAIRSFTAATTATDDGLAAIEP
jgi:hypothetical protein